MLRVVVHSGITPRCGLLKTHVSSFFSYTKVPSAPCGRAFSTVSISSPSMLVLCCPRLHRPPQLTSVVATLQGGRRCAASFGRDGKVRRNAPIQSTDYDEKDDEDTYYSSVSSSVHEISADRAQTGKEAALLVDNDERRNATKKVVDNKICTGGSNASTSSFKSLRVPAHVYTNLHHVRVHHPTKLQKMVIPHLIRWYDKERGTAYMPPTVGIQGTVSLIVYTVYMYNIT